MIDFTRFNNLIDLMTYFNNETVCKQAIIESRWGEGEDQDIACPYCGQHHCAKRIDGKFRCNKCKRNFSCTVGTIFEDTNLSLVKWFVAMYLISSHKKGISSSQLARDIKVTQATAWHVLHKVRKLYAQGNTETFSGEIECDEVYIGGKEKWKHKSMKTPHTQGRSTVTKAPVFGVLERTEIINKWGEKEHMSYVRAMVVKNTKGETLLPIISRLVEVGSTVFTDELSAYNRLVNMGYGHEICDHGEQQFVVGGKIYTNNIECFWSHFRRMIAGCYHNVSDEHLQSYIDEAVYRWNMRKASQMERFVDMFAKCVGLTVTWEELRLCEVA